MSGAPPVQGQPQLSAPAHPAGQPQPVYYGGGGAGQPQQRPVVYASQPAYGAQPTATVVNVPVQRESNSNKTMWIVVGVVIAVLVCCLLVVGVPVGVFFVFPYCCAYGVYAAASG